MKRCNSMRPRGVMCGSWLGTHWASHMCGVAKVGEQVPHEWRAEGERVPRRGSMGCGGDVALEQRTWTLLGNVWLSDLHPGGRGASIGQHCLPWKRIRW